MSREGEFVKFDLVLPNNVPSETNNSYSISLDDSDLSVMPKISIHDGHQPNRSRIV